MNNQTFDHLIDWLEAGAPEYLFSMHFDWADYENNDEPAFYPDVEAQKKQKPECGTVCCIAGYLDQGENETEWYDVQENALRKLGLPQVNSYMIPLFDPDAAGSPTPQQAAEAVRRFRDHYAIHKDILFDPWSEE